LLVSGSPHLVYPRWHSTSIGVPLK